MYKYIIAIIVVIILLIVILVFSQSKPPKQFVYKWDRKIETSFIYDGDNVVPGKDSPGIIYLGKFDSNLDAEKEALRRDCVVYTLYGPLGNGVQGNEFAYMAYGMGQIFMDRKGAKNGYAKSGLYYMQ
jgi:hypothetical protein